MAYRSGTVTRAREAIEDLKIGSVGHYEAMIDGYLKLRDQFAKPFWDTAYDLFENDQFNPYSISAASPRYGIVEVQPARVFGLVQQIESQIVANRPSFVVDPLKARSEDLAKWGGIVVNADWERTRALNSEFRMNVRNTIFTGWGPMLSGVETDYAKARRARKVRDRVAQQCQEDPLLGEIQAELIGEAAQGPDSVSEIRRATNFEMTDLVWNGRVFSRAISPFHFLIDPNCASLEDAEWCGRMIVARLDQVKKNPLFTSTRGLKPSAISTFAPLARQSLSPKESSSIIGTTAREGTDDCYERILLFELAVRQPDGTWNKCVLAKDHGKPLQEVEDWYDIGCPYRLLRWNHTSRRVFATSDVQSVMNEVIEEREVLTRLHDAHLRSPLDTYVGSRQRFTQDTDIVPVTVPGVGQILLLENIQPGEDASKALTLLQKGGEMDKVLPYLAILERRYQEATGLGANQQSQALKSETSATEAAEIAKWASARGRSKFAFCEEFAANVAGDRLGLICQFYGPEDIAALAGPEAAKFWVKERFTAGDIQAGLSVRVEQGSMQPRDDASVAAVLQALWSACINPQTALLANVHINAHETFSEWLRRIGVPVGSKLLNETGPDLNMKLGAIMQMLASQGQAGGGGAPGVPASGRGGGAAPPAKSSNGPSGKAEARQEQGSQGKSY